MANEPKSLHLIYIHGFQGDHTTFQSFPLDLQQHLEPLVRPRQKLKVQSSLYPTYKSVKPLTHATLNFLEWLDTQPAGPVILLGHSMGGLLAADAACVDKLHSRIIGMIAFDCPYLGMHPHVVISGIASLFDDKDKKQENEDQMNDHPEVNFVDERVTDEWEGYKRDNNITPSVKTNASYKTAQTSLSTSSSPSFTSSQSILSAVSSNSKAQKAMSFLNSHADDPLVRWVKKHRDAPVASGKTWIVERFQFGSAMFAPSDLKARYANLVKWGQGGGLWVNYWTITTPKIKPDSSKKKEEQDKEVKRDNDVALIESGMAELPSPSMSSSTSLEKQTPLLSPSSTSERPPLPPRPSTTTSSAPPSPRPGTPSSPESPTFGPQTKSEAKKEAKAAEKERKAIEKQLEKDKKAHAKSSSSSSKEKDKEKVDTTTPRHFIVLPTGLGSIFGGGENWEKVQIDGANDEVDSHCGLFLRDKNLDYDGLVERVGKRVLDWCDRI